MENAVRKRVLRVLVNDREKKSIEVGATEAGMSTSCYLRWLALYAPEKVEETNELDG